MTRAPPAPPRPATGLAPVVQRLLHYFEPVGATGCASASVASVERLQSSVAGV